MVSFLFFSPSEVPFQKIALCFSLSDFFLLIAFRFCGDLLQQIWKYKQHYKELTFQIAVRWTQFCSGVFFFLNRFSAFVSISNKRTASSGKRIWHLCAEVATVITPDWRTDSCHGKSGLFWKVGVRGQKYKNWPPVMPLTMIISAIVSCFQGISCLGSPGTEQTIYRSCVCIWKVGRYVDRNTKLIASDGLTSTSFGGLLTFDSENTLSLVPWGDSPEKVPGLHTSFRR